MAAVPRWQEGPKIPPFERLLHGISKLWGGALWSRRTMWAASVLCAYTHSQRTMWSLGKYSYGAGVARALLRQALPQPPSLSNFTENRSRYKLALLFVSRLSSGLTWLCWEFCPTKPPVSSDCQLSASLVKAKVLQRSPTHINPAKLLKFVPLVLTFFGSLILGQFFGRTTQ